MLIFELGLAVAEMPQTKLEALHERALKEYICHLSAFNHVSNNNSVIFSGSSFSFTIRKSFIEQFKEEIKAETVSGKKIWTGYNYIKSEIVNHWLPHFEIKSGENVDDAMERVRMHVWAFRTNLPSPPSEGRNDLITALVKFITRKR